MPRDIIIYVDSPVVTMLREARARIERGWTRRAAIQRRSFGYAYCAGGALTFDDRGRSKAHDDHVSHAHASCALNAAVQKLTRSPDISVVKFNDWWERTQADVVEAFDVAIELQIRAEQELVV